MSGRRLEWMSWPEIQEAASQPGSTVIWPFGAFEQHGPHLPVCTDSCFAEMVLESIMARISSDRPIWRLPLQTIGFSPEHEEFPGTLSISAELVLMLVEQVGRQLAKAGFKRLILFNAHGGQIGLLQVAARQLRARYPSLGVLPCFLWSGPEGLIPLLPEPERHEGLHAGLAETSLMLYLQQNKVGKSRPWDGIKNCPNPPLQPPIGWTLEGNVPNAWLSSDLSFTGVIGDSRDSNSVLGEQLFTLLVNGWSARFESLLDSSWPPQRLG
uniref:Creatininase n=1 Tax=Paulinella chromatophora TaxID=39717 RepID=B1X5T5_PAUCH|nr:creatininase [Paulinella chromatophora]ACB43304.1 creatininase [Paulinella chromatophora]|eukprot:gb/GEZN01012635.1/.p1 GENE.gb/GEZN01012635.1/~~gb/GEZN01012635.1/.p1  ORF type:complete len:269 (+),score=-10.54 gb/GEZN01012635.1/:241-1047(+)